MLYMDPPEDLPGRLVVGTAALMFALAAAWGIRFAFTCGRLTVLAGPDVIRIGPGGPIQWGDVARIRERAWLQRVDLIGHAGRRLGSIEYQVERVDELIDRLRGHIPRPMATLQRHKFGRRFAASYLAPSLLVLAAFVALGLWLWASEGEWIGLLVPPALLWGLYAEFRDQLRELELRQESLVLRTILRERIILREDIVSTQLLLTPVRNGKLLSVMVVLRDGRSVWIQPAGQDAQEVHATVKSWRAALARPPSKDDTDER